MILGRVNYLPSHVIRASITGGMVRVRAPGGGGEGEKLEETLLSAGARNSFQVITRIYGHNSAREYASHEYDGVNPPSAVRLNQVAFRSGHEDRESRWDSVRTAERSTFRFGNIRHDVRSRECAMRFIPLPSPPPPSRQEQIRRSFSPRFKTFHVSFLLCFFASSAKPHLRNWSTLSFAFFATRARVCVSFDRA